MLTLVSYSVFSNKFYCILFLAQQRSTILVVLAVAPRVVAVASARGSGTRTIIVAVVVAVVIAAVAAVVVLLHGPACARNVLVTDSSQSSRAWRSGQEHDVDPNARPRLLLQLPHQTITQLIITSSIMKLLLQEAEEATPIHHHQCHNKRLLLQD